MPGVPEIRVYKNNTDNKGRVPRHPRTTSCRGRPISGAIVGGLLPFFATRQVITGAGRVGIGQDGRGHGFQLSQRADFFEVEVGLETTLKRPMINTRDERMRTRSTTVACTSSSVTRTSPRYPLYLKMGMTSLVLSLIEADVDLSDLALSKPVTQLHQVSYDVTLAQR